MVSDAIPPVPVRCAAMTAEWLTAALRSTGAIAPATRVLRCEPLPVIAFTLAGEAREDGGGFSGPQLIRLNPTYADGPGPEQIVAKSV